MCSEFGVQGSGSKHIRVEGSGFRASVMRKSKKDSILLLLQQWQQDICDHEDRLL